MRLWIALAALNALVVAGPVSAQAIKGSLPADRVLETIIGTAPGAVPDSLSKVEPTEGLTAQSVTQAQIDSFIESVAMIRRVTRHWMPQIEAETDGSARADMIDQANRDIVAAVVLVADITPSDYVAIDRAVQSDPGLKDRVDQRAVELAAIGDGRIRKRVE